MASEATTNVFGGLNRAIVKHGLVWTCFMCGIAGIVGYRNYSVAMRMLEKIRHRGPDGDGIWLSPQHEDPVSLCHARLSILDLSDQGTQPFHSQDNRYVLVFNGEIYNFLELRRELTAKYGAAFRSETDTEVLLQGIVYEGIGFVSKCNGMWAFALWDRVQRKLTLCRDRFGVKPLYYTMLSDGRIGFASEMKGLVPLLSSVSPAPYIDSIFRHQFEYEFSDLCAVGGIRRLPAGSFAELNNGRLDIIKWWNTLDHVCLDQGTYASQVDCWRDLFLDSIKLRMRSDVRIGTALSGGLDSSSVMAAMALIGSSTMHRDRRIADDWQYGICCTYPGGSLDETRWARKVADSCGVTFKGVVIDPMNCGWDILQSLSCVEDPYLTIPIPMLATYQAIKKLGVGVTLDGHGADELFCGYGHLRHALGCAKTYSQYSEIMAIDESTRTGIFSCNERASIKEKLRYHVRLFLANHNLFPRSWIKAHLLSSRLYRSIRYDELSIELVQARIDMQSHEAFKAMDVFSQVLYEMFHLTILPTLLRNYDRYSMASGLEVRMPFMDWRLVSYTFSLPWHAKLGGTFTKRVQRDALSGILCDPVLYRRDKIGWNAPAHEWFKGPLLPFMDDLMSSRDDSLYSRKSAAAWEHFRSIHRPSFADGQQLWNSILPQLWIRSLTTAHWN